MKDTEKNIIKEATGSGSSGKMRIPLVLAPQTWTVQNLEPFVTPVSEYISAMNAYDSYDGNMERDSQTINKNERNAIDKAKRAKAMFTQSDDEGNPMNGYVPNNTEVPGTPEYIKRIANLPKNDYQDVLKEELLKEDLAVWFGTKKKPKGSKQPKGPWVNICRKKEGGGHPPCGRPEADSKGYPKCRAAGVASKMTDAQKKSACQQKRKAEKADPKVGKGNTPTMTSYKPKKSRNEQLRDLVKKVLRESIR